MTEQVSLSELMSRLTLEEKVGQLNLAPNEDGVDPELIRSGKLGGLICAASAYAGNECQERIRVDRLNELQRVATEESQLRIPLIVGRDVIHGHRTVAPIPLGQACSWSAPDVEACAKIASDEAFADGIRWVYTPMLDIARDPRWGRVAEGYGEDPYLCSTLAKAAVKGLQQMEGGNLRVAACAKHFAGYGSVEGGRDYNTGEIGPFTMRNIYLPPFKAAVEAGVASIMTCFNDLSGIPMSANSELIRDVLKDEWGFDGFTVSDWGAVAELIEHGVAESNRSAAQLAIQAGVDMDMASDAYIAHLPGLVEQGLVPESLLDDAVRRLLEVKMRLGLFESPYADPFAHGRVFPSSSSRETTLALNRKCVVMLKNNAVLPFGESLARIGLFGPMVDERESLLGTWCLDGEASDVVTMREAFVEEFGSGRLHVSVFPDESANLARYCDVAVICVGESRSRSGEANSVCSLGLPAGQLEFIQAIKQMGLPVVAVVFAGRPLDLSWLDANVDAILYCFHPGLFGAVALAEIVSGRVSPSGRLPITFPRSVGQIPLYYNHRPTGRPLDPCARGVTRYIDELDSPLYPFGFGLTYGNVSYENLAITRSGSRFSVRCSLRNAGSHACDEVAQLYLRDVVARVARPVRELKGFSRIALAVGESCEVEFSLGEEELGYYTPDGKWTFDPGEFVVWAGPDSRGGLSEHVTL